MEKIYTIGKTRKYEFTNSEINSIRQALRLRKAMLEVANEHETDKDVLNLNKTEIAYANELLEKIRYTWDS